MTDTFQDLEPAQLDEVLAYLPLLEQPDFSPGEWSSGGYQMPYFSYHPRFDEFIDTLYETGFVFNFNWMDWQDEAKRLQDEPAALAEADLLTLRKLLSAHVRADRFVDGHLAQIHADGHLLGIMRRLAQLRTEMAAPPVGKKLRGPDEQPPRPNDNTYWLIPGKVLVGEYPGYAFDPGTRLNMRRFLKEGVNFFLDLTEENELYPYEQALQHEAAARDLSVTHVRKPIVDRSIPTVAEMHDILNTIDQAIADDRTVYIHCRGGIGRTGTVVGCYLVRHGNTSDEALKEIARLWQNMQKKWRVEGSPETDEQVAFIQDWAEGE